MEQWIVAVICFALLVFVCRKEYRRANRAHLVLRLITTFLAVTALYFIAAPLSFKRYTKPENNHTALLITPGFHSDSLSDLGNIPAFSTEKSITDSDKNIRYVSSLESFAASHPQYNTLHILGSGFDPYQLKYLAGRHLILHPGVISGLTSASWNNHIRSGDQLTIQGTYNNTSSRAAQLTLKGLGTTLDSVSIPAGKSQTFTLNTIPKLLGQTVYNLAILSGTDTLAIEKIPVVIDNRSPLRVLILSSSPGFETKFLKNWLFAENYAIAIRTNISKDKFSTEYLNTKKIPLNRITPALLKNVDLLVSDITQLAALPANDNLVIRNQIAQGMGLVIRTDSVPTGNDFFSKTFTIRQTRTLPDQLKTLNWAGHTATKSTGPSVSSLEIVPATDQQPLVSDKQNHILASSKISGAGRIVINTLNDTYTWVLANNLPDYASYWSYLLGKAARKSTPTLTISPINQFPTVNEQTDLELENHPDSLPEVKADNVSLKFAQNPTAQYLRTARYWPAVTGWQDIYSSGQKVAAWYIFDKTDWINAKASKKLDETRSFINEQQTSVRTAEQAVSAYTYTVPTFYFFILLVLCCTYLWLEPKLS